MGHANTWDAEWDVSTELAKELITSQFPQLSAKPIQRLGYGWDNTVYLVGDEYVFRFPRRTIAIEAINMEGKMLPMLADYITLPYAKPVFYGVGNSEYPLPFLGYLYVTGEFPSGLTDEQRAQSAAVLGQFLQRLHSFPIQVAKEHGIQTDHGNLLAIASRKEKMLGFMSDLTVHLDEEERCLIADYLHQLNTARLQQRDVFLHGDLHFKNLLVDPSGRVSGIIDWGDMSIGHPGCDLNIAFSFLPPHARPEFFKEYGEVDEETTRLARMIAVYIPMLVLMQAIDEHDEKIAKEAKATIKRALAD